MLSSGEDFRECPVRARHKGLGCKVFLNLSTHLKIFTYYKCPQKESNLLHFRHKEIERIFYMKLKDILKTSNIQT